MSEKNNLIVVLSQPITYLDEEITELTLREPIVEDFFALTADALAHPYMASLQLASSAAEIPLSVLKKMCVKDMLAVADKVAPFLYQSQ
jgi:hypothetical protein